MKYTWTILTSIALIAAGCGGAEQKPAPGTSGNTDASTTPKQENVADETTEEDKEVAVTLGSNDQMQFDKKEIKVPAGSTVTLTLVHNGKMSKEAMGHNFVLLKQGTDISAFGAKAIEAGIENEHIPAGDAIIAHTGLIGGGEQTSVTFDAPAKGTYDFICSFPGHYATMQGKFIVE